MTDLSEQISRLAKSYDPDREADALAVRSVLQGAMYMQAGMNNAPSSALGDIVAIADVEQLADENGTYLPYFTIITKSGHRIRVTLEVE